MSSRDTSPIEIGFEGLSHSRVSRSWTWWMVPKQFDLVTSLLYISIPLLSALLVSDGSRRPIGWWPLLCMIIAVVILLIIDRFEYYFYEETTPRRIAIMLMIARAVLIEVVAQLDQFRFSPFLYLIIPLLTSLYFGIVPGYIFMVVVWIVFFLKEFWINPAWLQSAEHVHYLVIYTIGLIFAIVMAHSFLMERCSRSSAERYLKALEESHEQLKVYAEQVAELATTKERNRLARDIHDTLGHYLTVINIQLEKALAFRGMNPQEAEVAVSEAKRFASEALRDVRHSVAALRNTPEVMSAIPSMTSLVESMRTEQRTVTLTVEGDPSEFSPQVQLALYHVVQEGLTNVQKHAKATQVLVDLRYDSDKANLSMQDDGCGFDPSILHHLPPGREGRYGLLGLQERLQLVGGQLHIESSLGNGTGLFVYVPKVHYASFPKKREGELERSVCSPMQTSLL